MEFRVLGPLEVIGPGGPIEITSARQRAILAVLVLNLGETVPRERLIDELWGDDPPPTAQHALGVHVAGLRRALGDGNLETQPSGYRLRGTGSQVDLQHFEALVAEASDASLAGDSRAAARRLRAALALWRGPALADLGAEHAARAQRARLDELRFAALERWIDAELASGRHLDVVPDLRRIVSEAPLREGFQVRLMLALYRSGRQAEALAVYREAREVLDRELGVEPGRELDALQVAVLAHDPALEPAIGTGSTKSAVAAPPNERPVEPAGTATAAPDLDPLVAPRSRLLDRGSGPVGARPNQRATRRTVTTLFAELSGPTTFGGRLDPESAGRPPARFFGEMRQILERHGGTVERLSADGILVVFGAPIAHEDDALRAVRAASEMRDAVAAFNDDAEGGLGMPIHLRVGLTTGEVLTSDGAHGGSPVSGDAARVAAILEGAARQGEVILDDETYRLVRWAVEVEAAGTIDLRGHSEPAKAFRLVGVTAGVGGHQRTFDSPLVGRERELRLLASAFEQAALDESCSLFSLLGPAGVGKSRLVHEFLGAVRPEAVVLRGRCLPYGEQAAWWPVAEAIKQAAGIGDGDPAAVVRQKIERLLGVDPRAGVIAELVASAIGATEAASTSEGAFWAIRTLFESLSGDGRPVVVVFDDVQWGEPAFLDLVEYIADTSKSAPLLLLCVARPELLDERPGWGGGKLNATSVLLKPLTNGEVSRLVANLLGAAASPALEEKIVEAAEGNPLFVEEFLAMLLEDGVVRREGDMWVPATDLGTVVTPASIMALLTSRLDRLPPDERETLNRAAIVGKVFGRDALEALALENDPIDLDRCLGSLVRRELIRPDRPGAAGAESFRFKHILIRDAAYAGVPKRERIALHERLAGWLAGSAEAGSALYDEVIGAHLEVSHRYRMELEPADERAREVGRLAAIRLGAAGRRAQVRGDAAVAENLLDRAVALLPARDPERLALLVDLTRVKVTRGEFEAAEQLNDELIRDARQLGLEALVWRGTLDKFGFDWPPPRAQAGRVRAAMEAAIQFFESSGDDRELGKAWWWLGNFEFDGGHVEAGRLAQVRAAEHSRRAGDVHGQSLALIEAACAEMEGPAPVTDAMRTAEELISWARTSGQLGTEGIALAVLGRLKAMVGDFDEGRRLVREGIAIGGQLGRTFHEAADSWRWIGFVEWLAGDIVAAELGLRRGYEALTRIGAATMATYVASELARMLYLQTRYEEAFEFTQFVKERDTRHSFSAGIQWRSVRALLLAQRGETAEAIDLAREAVTIAGNTDRAWVHGRAVEDLAEVLVLSGRVDEALLVFAEAIGLYERKGITVLAARARDRLVVLQSMTLDQPAR